MSFYFYACLQGACRPAENSLLVPQGNREIIQPILTPLVYLVLGGYSPDTRVSRLDTVYQRLDIRVSRLDTVYQHLDTRVSRLDTVYQKLI